MPKTSSVPKLGLTKCSIGRVTYHPSYKYQVRWNQKNGGGVSRQRKYFKLKQDAERFAADKERELTEFGVSASDLTNEERQAIIAARQQIADYESSLSEVIDRGLASLAAENVSTNVHVSDLIEETIALREDAGAATRTLEDYYVRLRGKFGATFGERAVWSVTREEIDGWIKAQAKNLTTRQRYRQLIKTAFGLAVEKGMRPDNPAKENRQVRTKKDTTARRESIDVYTPGEVSAWLSHAPSDSVPALAISFFAGVRPGSANRPGSGELMRLDWSDIDFVEKRIRVSGDTSKGGALRFVPMSENLVHWLLPHRRNSGPIAPTNYQGKRLRARQAAQVRAIHDGARHSFGTYHCLINGADSTRDVMGHEESSRTLEKHYRSASATVEQAEAFWSISPKEDCVIELKVAL